YLMYRRIKNGQLTANLALFFFVAFPIFALLYSNSLISFPAFFYFIIFLVSIPFIFIFSKDKKIDAAMGALSYPVYLSHLFVFKILTNTPVAKLNHSTITVLTIITTLIVSYLMTVIIEKPLDVL